MACLSLCAQALRVLAAQHSSVLPHCLWEIFVLCLGSACLVKGPDRT